MSLSEIPLLDRVGLHGACGRAWLGLESATRHYKRLRAALPVMVYGTVNAPLQGRRERASLRNQKAQGYDAIVAAFHAH